METFAFFLIALGILWSFYWAVMRPVLLETVKDGFSYLRAEMDWNIINGMEGSQSEAAIALDADLNSCVDSVQLSLGQLLWVGWFQRKQIEARADQRNKVYNDSPAWIRDTRVKLIWLSTKAMLINSPAWWVLLPIISLAAYQSLRVCQWWNNVQSEAVDAAVTKEFCGLALNRS